MITINLSKQQALDIDPKAIQQINFTENLDRDENRNTAMLFVIGESVLDYSQETVNIF